MKLYLVGSLFTEADQVARGREGLLLTARVLILTNFKKAMQIVEQALIASA